MTSASVACVDAQHNFADEGTGLHVFESGVELLESEYPVSHRVQEMRLEASNAIGPSMPPRNETSWPVD
jgi:hypothetical protein